MTNRRSVHFTVFDIAGATTALVLLYLSSLYNYLLFHVLAEFYSISIAMCIFCIGWNLRTTIHNNYLVFISIAYLFVGLLDLLHTMTYKGMGIFSDYDYYANQVWIAARSMEAMTLCLGFYAARLKERLHGNTVFCLYAAATVLVVASVLYWKNFPVCFVEGDGLTDFKVYSEYGICGILFLSLFLLSRHKELFSADVYRLMQLSILFTIISELAFTFYVDNYGFSNLVGHYFKIFSFYTMYRALIATGINEPYKFYLKSLDDSNKNLRRQSLAMENQVKYFNAVFNNSEVGILVAADGVIFDLNAKFLEISGFSRQELLGRDLASVKRFARIREILRETFESGGGDTIDSTETVLTTRDEQARWISLSGKRYLDTNTQRNMVVLVVEDITSRKQMEALKEDVERIVRHDLLSPLSNVVSLLDLMEYGEASSMDDIVFYHQLMKKSALRMLRLVRSSSDLYKIENRTYEIQFDAIDLVALFREVEQELREKLEQRKVGVTYDLGGSQPDGQGYAVCGDYYLLFELFSNLLRNAVEASEGDQVYVFFCREPSSIRVQILNSLPVPREIRDRFFEKYVTSKKTGGTGLGTYIAKLLVEAHSGEILLETDEAFGTLLSVRLSTECLLPQP